MTPVLVDRVTILLHMKTVMVIRRLLLTSIRILVLELCCVVVAVHPNCDVMRSPLSPRHCAYDFRLRHPQVIFNVNSIAVHGSIGG